MKWNFIFNRLKPVPQQKLSDKLIPVLVPVLKTRQTILENTFFLIQIKLNTEVHIYKKKLEKYSHSCGNLSVSNNVTR